MRSKQWLYFYTETEEDSLEEAKSNEWGTWTDGGAQLQRRRPKEPAQFSPYSN
jgi:hypothetical protein